MPSYSNLLSRVNSPWIQEHIGAEALRVLTALEDSTETTKSLKEIFNSIIGPYELIANKKIRDSFFEFLKPEEVASIAKFLDLKGRPEVVLNDINLKRGSVQFNKICDFFQIPHEPVEEKNETIEVNSVVPTYSVFSHQQKAINSVIAQLEKGGKRVLLHMPTGAGKTRMAMHVICNHLLTHTNSIVIWLANSEELCQQASEEFVKAWSSLGNRGIDIYRFWGKKDLVLKNIKEGLFVGGYAKLYTLAKSKNNLVQIAGLGDKTSLLVIDEAHQSIAETYSLIIKALSSRKIDMPILGLSATPGRTWNDPAKDKKLANFFNRKKVTLQVEGFPNPIDFLIKENYLAQPIYKMIKSQDTRLTEIEIKKLAGELDVPSYILKKLASNEIRTVSIIREIQNLNKKHKRTIVFATTVEHAKLINAILNHKNILSTCVTAESSENQRRDAINWFKDSAPSSKVIINFGVLTTGFDAPRTSAVLIARPTKSLVLYSQMVGRAIRGVKAGGNKTAEIVTVVDTALTGFGDLISAFNNWEDVW